MGVYAALAAAAISAGAGAASAATARGPNTDGPTDITRENVFSLAGYGNPTLLLNKLYNPAFAQIGNRTAEQSLFGTPGGSIRRPVWVYRNGQWQRTLQQVPQTAQRGLLDIYERAGTRMADFNRQQTMADLQAAPEALQAYLSANPLLRSLQERAQQGLDQGGALDASTRRMLQQSAFGDASMRGFGHSPLDAFMAYSAMGAESEARMRQREQFALQTQGMLPDPFSLVRTPSVATTYGPALGMQGAQWSRQSANPVFNPFAFSQSNTTQPDNTTSNILGAISGGMLNLAGGFAGGAGRSQAAAGYQGGAGGTGGQYGYGRG